MDDTICSQISNSEEKPIKDAYSNPLFEKYKSSTTIRRAIKSAIKFNRKLNKQRNEERRSFFDTQTLTIHYPQKRKITINESKQYPYPIATLPWQYQERIQQYPSKFLQTLPFNTPINCISINEELYDKKYLDNLEFLTKHKIQNKVNFNEDKLILDLEDNDVKILNDETDTISLDSIPKSQTAIADWCSMCGTTNNDVDQKIFIACTECFKTGHPGCFGLTPQMTEIIKTYPWQCLNCKTCIKCFNAGGESEIMCCDKCDRGYHSYCVGLKAIPQNQWECPKCIQKI